MTKVYIGGRGDVVSKENSKKTILAALRSGFSVDIACQSAGRSRSSYDIYRREDPDFRRLADEARHGSLKKVQENRQDILPFPDFCQEYLDTTLFRHHLQWYDLLEGKPPRDLSPNQRYVPGDTDSIMVNTPPEHAKSTVLTVNYVVWRICQDPNIRILIVSKTQDMAKKFLVSIKDRLAESDTYYKLQTDFAPQGGFADGSTSWSADRIYVNGRDSGEKDPTVQAVGIKGHIYGSRCDLAIMDDCVDHTNHQEYAKQINWIQTQVGSRVADGAGRMLLIGTRMETTDLYSEILKPEYYPEDTSPWTYLTQPAVEEYAEDPKDWKTLWPATNRPPVSVQARKIAVQNEDGLWPMWDGPALARKRRKMSVKNWTLVYQQEQVADDATFSAKDINGCTERRRYAGRMFDGQPGHRRFGMDGLYVVAGLDPATTGHTAAVVLGVDRESGRRYVLDVFNRPGTLPHELRDLIKGWTERYGVQEWRIEKNAFQGSIIQDLDLRSFCNGRGCLLTGHFTNGNKWDSDFGVASMALLFQDWEHKRNLIELPSSYQSEGMRSLVEQLTSWFPATKGKTDTVMALWFAEIRARELMEQGEFSAFHLQNEFASMRDTEDQVVIDVDYVLAQGGSHQWNGRW
jgi:hypothetical protein